MNTIALTKKISVYMLIAIYSICADTSIINLTFHGTNETLSTIKEIILSKRKGAYFRFGDGDVNLAIGENDLLQSANLHLQSEMCEAFALHDQYILKTLPLYCKEFGGYETGMFPGNHQAPYEWCLSLLDKAKNIWNGPFDHVYSHCALHFAATQNPDECINFLKFLKNSNCCLLIGNKNIPSYIRQVLLGPRCIFVPTPPEQSYDQIDSIEQECLKLISKNNDYKIIITAMGCSGRILQKRLLRTLDNVFLFDFGSLMDALCGWNTRAWIELTKFDANTFIDNLSREVKILYTAALIDQDYDSRKEEYIRTLEILKAYGYTNPHIVEALTQSNVRTFFNEYSCNVLYSDVNNLTLKNKGINEANSIREAFKKFNFRDNDIIIKITGRYYFTSDEFLRLVENNATVDAFVKTDETDQVFTGCFALRYKYFKEMLDQIDYQKMEDYMINFEQEVARYLAKLIKEKSIKVTYLNKLNITAPIFGNGPINITYW